ncbi:MAG: shikimate dehydrogenase [Candidatus Omnitrophota bacterium]
MTNQVYGLIGYPVKHSLSPLMHNAALAELRINAEYKLFPLKEEELGDFLKNAAGNNICGLNITVPYKEKVIPFLSNLSQEAKLIGAVNTVKVNNNKLEGFNTDGEGFIRHLKDLGFIATNKTIAIIGAGGAARAICVYLSRNNPKKILIYDIDKTRACGLIKHLQGNFSGTVFNSVDLVTDLNIQESDLLINASSNGMREEDALLVEAKEINSKMLVYDLIYNPRQTKLLEMAQVQGARVSNGLGMLLYQGVAAFELWTGKIAPVEVMRKALNEGVKNL